MDVSSRKPLVFSASVQREAGKVMAKLDANGDGTVTARDGSWNVGAANLLVHGESGTRAVSRQEILVAAARYAGSDGTLGRAEAQRLHRHVAILETNARFSSVAPPIAERTTDAVAQLAIKSLDKNRDGIANAADVRNASSQTQRLHARTIERISGGGSRVDVAMLARTISTVDAYRGDTLRRGADGTINGTEWHRFLSEFGPYPWFKD